MEMEIRNLCFSYNEILILNNINYIFFSGEIILIKGVNGSGKTTLLKCMAGILNSGKNIYIDNAEVSKNKELLQKISYVMSEDTLYDYLTIDENITLFAEMFGEGDQFIQQVNHLIALMGLDNYRTYLVKHLSDGTRYKIYLAVMLAKSSLVLILDEPFSSIDRETQKLMIDYITELKKEKIIIYVTHIKEFEQIATRTIILEKGVE